jgi:hypothetical protein
MFDMVISKRGRIWEWQVTDPAGKAVMRGGEFKRRMASYHAARALFLLLMTVRMPERDREDNL